MSEPTTDPRTLLTVRDAAKRLQVCEKYVYELINKGHLAFVAFGRQKRITPFALDKLIEKKTIIAVGDR